MMEQGAPLEVGLVNQPKVVHREVAQAAVDHLGGGAAGGAAKIAGVDQCSSEPGAGRLVGDTAADDAPADDQQVELGFGQLFKGASASGLAGFAHPGSLY